MGGRTLTAIISCYDRRLSWADSAHFHPRRDRFAVSAPAQPPFRPDGHSPPHERDEVVSAAPPAARRRPRIIAVMPAYNAERTLVPTLADIPADCVDEVILVDDGSTDGTVALARKMGLTVIVHPANRGYGANQKTCYGEALARGSDIVVMIHPDYQYDSRAIPAAVSIIELGTCDIILGNRIRSRPEALRGGMPAYKYVFNRVLTLTENLLLGQNLGDFHSGFRVMRREVLERIPFERNSDDFLFDTQFLVQAVHFGFRLGDIPVPVRYFDAASSINFRRSVVYGLGTLAMLGIFWLDRLRIARSRLFVPKA
jgi:glycosyltransferase involved in cell wall biosynthesis